MSSRKDVRLPENYVKNVDLQPERWLKKGLNDLIFNHGNFTRHIVSKIFYFDTFILIFKFSYFV